MKKIFHSTSILILGLLAAHAIAQTTISLSFTATLNGAWQPADSICIENLSRGGDTTLTGNDTVLVLSHHIGIESHPSNATQGMVLFPACPNPADGETKLHLFLPSEEVVSLYVLDLPGRQAKLFSQKLHAGDHYFRFYPGGEKFCFIVAETANERQVQKLIHLSRGKGNGRIDHTGSMPGVNHMRIQNGSFWWIPGDTLRFTAWLGNHYHMVIEDRPLISKPYTFELIIGQPCPGMVTVTDYSGNVYNTVQIGSQCWMKENLKVSHLNNGTAIPIITDNSTWAMAINRGRCWYNNDSAMYASTYGALYNWFVIQDNSICPFGWHVPDNAEWDYLTFFLGGDALAGGPLKATTQWYSPNTGATDYSGFSALPGGFRDFMIGEFSNIRKYGYWWSSTKQAALFAWDRTMDYNSAQIHTTYNPVTYGFSVRCIWDQN